MARFIWAAATAAHRARKAGASCAGLLAAQRHCYLHRPNWELQGPRSLSDFCGHSNLTENVPYGKT